MKKYPFRPSDTDNLQAEYDRDLRATGDSINDIDHALAEMDCVQRQAENVKIDLDKLVEQVGWAEEQQELWLTTTKDLRKHWSVREPVTIKRK